MALVDELSNEGGFSNFRWAKDKQSVGFAGFVKYSTVIAAAAAGTFLFSLSFLSKVATTILEYIIIIFLFIERKPKYKKMVIYLATYVSQCMLRNVCFFSQKENKSLLLLIT